MSAFLNMSVVVTPGCPVWGDGPTFCGPTLCWIAPALGDTSFGALGNFWFGSGWRSMAACLAARLVSAIYVSKSCMFRFTPFSVIRYG
jgi:hypothetical protein